MSYEAKIILDSISPQGHRLTTIQATFPRFILAEVNTHRMFSRNSASSRAIPVKDRIKQIEVDPFVPIAFGKNKAGMQAGEELAAAEMELAATGWRGALGDAVKWAKYFIELGVHKQWANRLIEVGAWHTAVISATEWDNHDGLRIHPAASPEYQTIATMMRDARNASNPRWLKYGEWHLPYVQSQDGTVNRDDLLAVGDLTGISGHPMPKEWLQVFRKVSVGRCAAVSYERQEVKNFEKDIKRYGDLKGAGHMSPFEHTARPMTHAEYDVIFTQPVYTWHDELETWKFTGKHTHFLGNFNGWVQDRKMILNEHDFSKVAR